MLQSCFKPRSSNITHCSFDKQHRHISGPDPAVPLVTAATGHRDICGAAGKDKARGHHTDHTSYSTAQWQQLSALRPSPPWRVLFVNIGGFQMQIGSQLTPPANWQACCCAACWHNRLCVRLAAPAVSWHQGSVHKVAGASSVQGYSTEMRLAFSSGIFSQHKQIGFTCGPTYYTDKLKCNVTT